MTKKQELAPGAKGCFAKAGEDEMLFVLRAQDVTAPLIVLEWIQKNFLNCPEDKLREAFECALAMKAHNKRKVAD